jgi:Tfp pilus assembly protein PilN
MIRINLLGGVKAKRGKRGVPAMMTPSGASGTPVLALVLVLALGAAGNAGYFWKLGHDRDRIAKEMEAADNENHRLTIVKQRYTEAEKEKSEYKRRVDLIEQLLTNQQGPVNLLTMIGTTVNNTDAVWLSTMKEEGNMVNIEGMALSPTAVANLIKNLEKTGYFKSVEIKETFQDDQVKDIQAFQFTLTCEKAQKTS